MKQKKIFFFFCKKNFKMADSKKLSFSTTPKSWAITAKISWIGPWVSRIDWCKGHWWGSTYMAVRLSDIRPKTGKICIFCVFMPFASINPTNPRTNLWNFGDNCSAFGGSWKTQFFWVGHFEFFFSKKIIFFCFILIQISHNLWGTKDFSKFWWLPRFPEKI